jgi:phage shock protein C
MKKRLYRSTKDKILGGLCGGIANYFNIDPVIIRLIFVAVMFLGGWAVLAYIIGWIIVPKECCATKETPCESPQNCECAKEPEVQEVPVKEEQI